VKRKMMKQQRYEELLPQIASLISGEKDVTSVLANVAAALHHAFSDTFFWTGFYMVAEGELRLGPFQGPVACMHIAHGRGVCGTSWAEGQTLVVADVEQFPGHIACSSLSRSEIVVPLWRGDEVAGVLDIDSRQLAAFDQTDRHYLETLCAMVASELW
jgi:GAF domain-containing protein